MISCKAGDWWELNPQRGRANNSAVLMRHKVTKEFFMGLWKRIELSGAGEPGIYLNNDKDWGTNPCCEIALRPYQFCNLCEVNVSNIKSQDDLNERVKMATFIGTLQASYTDFHYLREIWKENTEKDALVGISMTGIGSGKILKYDMKKAASVVKRENTRVAKIIGINPAARTSTVKPAGTTSLVLGTSSGIHAWHNDYYIRRLRVGKNEAIYGYLQAYHNELLEDDYFRPHDTAVISIPQMAPRGSILRTESPMALLERIKRVATEWVKPGHRKGSNGHNVSATVSLKEGEWDEVGEWMWENRKHYNGLSVLPYNGGTYVQAPFEDIDKDKYNELMESLNSIDLTRVVEMEDNTDLSGELACAGGACEIT
jgi:ribonucleoside-diphosphate reductase alpha chain